MRSLAPWPDNPLYAARYAAFIVVVGIGLVGLRRFVLGVSLVFILTLIALTVLTGNWVVHTVGHALGGL